MYACDQFCAFLIMRALQHFYSLIPLIILTKSTPFKDSQNSLKNKIFIWNILEEKKLSFIVYLSKV